MPYKARLINCLELLAIADFIVSVWIAMLITANGIGHTTKEVSRPSHHCSSFVGARQSWFIPKMQLNTVCNTRVGGISAPGSAFKLFACTIEAPKNLF